MERPRILLVTAALILGLTVAAALVYHGEDARERVTNEAGAGHDDELDRGFDAELETSGLIGQPRPDFRLVDLEGETRAAADWDGAVLMVNFWATWCEPCVREIPALIDLQNRFGNRGLQVVGIAIDDLAEVERFLPRLDAPIAYPILLAPGQVGVDVATAWGNAFGILPYTVIIDRAGHIAYAHYGEFTLMDGERELPGLL